MSDQTQHIDTLSALFTDRNLEREYQEYSAKLEAERERGILYFAITLYIAYGVLDLMVLKEAAFEAVAIRAICSFVALTLVFWGRFGPVKKHFQIISSGIMCVGAFSISYFIWREGTISPPYYVGIIEVCLLFTALVRGYFIISVLSFCLIYGSYILASLGFPKGTDYIASHFFLTHSLILCASLNHVLEVKRRNEFLQHSETINLNVKLQEMVDEANLSLKRKNAIMNILTHVFRTPLHQIIGYAQILEQESLGKQQHPEYVEYSGHIHSAGQNLLRLVQRLMKYGRLEAGSLKMTIQKVSVNELVNCALSGVSRKAAERRVNIEYARQPCSLYADGSLMEDAIFEIVENAVEASPHGGTVTISACEADNVVSILITDQGTGIDAEQLDNIRNSMELTEEFLGVSEKMSLGVTLTEKIVALHNGTLDIRRDGEKGTTVEIMVPVQPHQEKADTPETSEAPSDEPAASSSANALSKISA